MADTQRASQIPVITRASHNGTQSLSALPSPHLGLVSPSRYPSVSGSPGLPSPSTPSTPSSGGGSTPFRTFRNFLSFGNSKHTPSPSVPSAIPKSHFSTLGPIRRSVNVERKVSSPQLARRSEDEYVLAIDPPRPGGEKSPNTRLSKSSDPSTASRSPLSSSHSPVAEIPASPSGVPASDLSTILEAETSGISKHLPSLHSSQAESEMESDISPHAFQPQALYPPPRNTRHGSSSPSNDTSALDLSTSKLSSEVLAALSETGGKQDWLNGVVVDDVPSDTAISRERTPESPDASFNLDSVDPELAALLSPNRVRGSSTEPAAVVANDALSPPTSSPASISPARIALSSAASPRSSTTSEMKASTSMRRIPATLSAASRPPPNFGAPRIARSASDRPVVASAGKSGPPSPATRTSSSSPERPLSRGSATAHGRLSRAFPGDTTATTSTPLRRPASSGNREERRTPASRLMTPARPSASSASTSRPPVSRLQSIQKTSWDAESASPPSRAPSSIGTAPSRLQDHRPSLDIERPRLAPLRTRKRSTSVIESRVTAMPPPSHPPVSLSGPRNMTDWIGPRTQKAFAAAGLLDFERESPGSASRPPSRFGTSRSSIDKDSRSRYTPSRMAYSEAGSSSSYGARSGSVSRAAGYLEGMSAVGPTSDNMSPRTVFSSASTAPTSVSASSLHSEIHQLQDKHALETSALLGALADSQRTTRLLREENGQLRERIQMLEDKLADAQERIQAILYSQPPSIPANPVYSKRYGSPASSERRSFPTHSRNSSLLRTRPQVSPCATRHSSPEPPSSTLPATPHEAADAFVPPHRKRMSGTSSSSAFASLPSNMSMIMQEEGVSPDTFAAYSQNSSSPPGSPTMVLARLNGDPSPGAYSSIPKLSLGNGFGHIAHKSMSSAGNISPTTANFSIMSGSPVSLNLRPEHERHLIDIAPLDLDAEGFEFDDSSLR